MELTRWGGIGVQLLLAVTGAAAARGRAAPPPEDGAAAISWQEAVPAADVVEAQRLAVLPADAPAWSIRFAPDHSRVAWIEADGAGERLAVNGATGPLFDAIGSRYVLGAIGGPVAYAARRSDRWHPIINHAIGEGYDAVAPPVAGPDGRQVAFVVTLDQANYVRLGADLHGPYDAVDALAWSGDGRHAAWLARGAHGMQVLVDGRPLPGSQGQRCWSLSLDHEGRQVAYMRQTERLTRLMVGDEPVLWPDDAVACWFGPGKDRAYTMTRSEGRQQCWHAGRRGEVHDLILDVALAPDGTRLAYRATEAGVAVLVVDGNRMAAGRNPSAPVWSQQGVHVAWCADSDAGPVVIVDGVPSEPIPGLADTVRFNADGTQVVFGAQRGRELWRDVLPVPLPPAKPGEPVTRR